MEAIISESDRFYSFLLLIGLLLIIYFALRRDPRIKYHMNKFTGPRYIPLFGILLSVCRPHHEFIPLISSWVNKYGGPCIPVWIANFIPYMAIVDPMVAEKILTSTVHIDKGKYDYTLLHPWLGTGLLTAAGCKWKGRRKLLSASFHFKVIENFIPIFNEQASVLVKCLEKESGSDQFFNIEPYITKCTLDIICETAMGTRLKSQTSIEYQEYIESVNKYLGLLTEKMMRPWLRIPLVYRLSRLSKLEKRYLEILHGFTDKVIQEKRLARENLRTSKGDLSSEKAESTFTNTYRQKPKVFLDLLFEASKTDISLNDDDIREETNTFMFEGNDTTGVNLCWTILMLAFHPDQQRKVHLELDELFGSELNPDLSMTNISKLKYLDCVIKETLRLYPSIPFIMRQINSNVILDDGRIIPKGVTALIAIYYIHRHKDYHSEPLSFKPERFLPEIYSNSTKSTNQVHSSSFPLKRRSAYSYIPFSAGSRNCIGQKFALFEEKVILAKLFHRYRIVAEITDREQVFEVPDIVLRNKDGFRVKLHPRRISS